MVGVVMVWALVRDAKPLPRLGVWGGFSPENL